MGAQETLGKLISCDERRDAVHVAVEPVQAGEDLDPSDHVGFGSDGMVYRMENGVGIIDPFLTGKVKRRDWCWLCVYPRTVKSLRHVWTHPYFDDEQVQKGPVHQKIEKAKEYLQSFADSIDRSYGDLLTHAHDYLNNGNYWHGGDSFEGVGVGEEFWEHFETVTGRTVPEDKKEGNFFSCSC